MKRNIVTQAKNEIFVVELCLRWLKKKFIVPDQSILSALNGFLGPRVRLYDKRGRVLPWGPLAIQLQALSHRLQQVRYQRVVPQISEPHLRTRTVSGARQEKSWT